jgi:exopolyphosphatase/guanosine-5'-triphosphate,3'-diphosphate pyrophosphatase
VLLHRSRAPDAIPDPKLKVGKKSLSLGFPTGWLREHPLTLADLRQEARYLEAAGYRLVLENGQES